MAGGLIVSAILVNAVRFGEITLTGKALNGLRLRGPGELCICCPSCWLVVLEVLSGLDAGRLCWLKACSPCLNRAFGSSGNIALSDKGLGTWRLSRLSARCMPLLFVVRGVLGGFGNAGIVDVESECMVTSVRGLAGMVSRRAPAVLGPAGICSILGATGTGLGGMIATLGEESGGGGLL